MWRWRKCTEGEKGGGIGREEGKGGKWRKGGKRGSNEGNEENRKSE